MHSDFRATSRRALVIIPETVNYFYNLSGRRIAEVLGDLGFVVDLSTLAKCPHHAYDFGLLSNITEVLHAFGDVDLGLRRLSAIRDRCRVVASLAIDCVSTRWYHFIRDYSARAGVSLIFDLGLHDQSRFLGREDRANYRFVFSGLTPSEARAVLSLDENDADRTIPWAFVGHMTPHRAALVDHLIQSVDPRGFVYMPPVAPYTEKGSPHLNQQQFERALARTKYQVWCSHHSHFYMEPERFRSSLLTGGVPVKIVDSRREIPKSALLSYLMMEPADLGERLSSRVFPRLRRLFWNDWRKFPTLRREIARALEEAGIDTGGCTSRAA
jgi:hypothetical protein